MARTVAAERSLGALGVLAVQSLARDGRGLGLAGDFVPEPLQRVVEIADDALFHWNDRVVRDGDVFGADRRAAFGDVAQADAVLFLEGLGAAFGVEGMQVERGVPARVGF